MEEAGDVGEVTLLAGHPEVARPGVEHHLEGLRRGSDGDGTVVLGVHVVGERLRLKTSGLVPPPSSQQVEGGVHLLEVGPSTLVLHQRDPHHLGLGAGVVVAG